MNDIHDGDDVGGDGDVRDDGGVHGVDDDDHNVVAQPLLVSYRFVDS